jgi:hypothetical protein
MKHRTGLENYDGQDMRFLESFRPAATLQPYTYTIGCLLAGLPICQRLPYMSINAYA